MAEKITSSEKKLKKFDVPLTPEKRDDKADVKAINGNPHQREKFAAG